MASSVNTNLVQVGEAPEPARRDFRREVTDRIINMLEQGVAPWQKPWNAADASLSMPTNPTTGKAYRGGNAIHLMSTGLLRGYGDPRWMTYRQAVGLGSQVRKGEKGTQIEFWDVKAASGTRSESVHAGEGDGHQLTDRPDDGRGNRLIHRVYAVFNVKQIEGIPEWTPNERSVFEVVEAAEQILRNCGAPILHDQANRAFYNRSADSIHLPPKHAFKDAPAYYGTALHEAAHSTGHPSRLNRATLNDSYRFGDISYAKEELRAELASVFLAAERGIPHDPEQHAAYVGAWIKTLKEDKNEIFRAAHDASRADDFLLALERNKSIASAVLPASPDLRDLPNVASVFETKNREHDRRDREAGLAASVGSSARAAGREPLGRGRTMGRGR